MTDHDSLDPIDLLRQGALSYAEFRRTDDPVDFAKAISLFESAVQAASDSHPRWHDFVSTLGLALWSKYGMSDDMTDLDRALERLAEAVRVKPDDQGVSEPLFRALGVRLERTDAAEDFDRLIGMVTELLAGIPTGEAVRLELVFALGAVWHRRYMRTKEPTNLDQAIDMYRQAAEQCPYDAPAGAVYRSAWEEALAVTPPDHPPPPRYFFNQGRARMLALERTNDWGELDAAIDLYEQGTQAVTQPPPGLLLNLAHAHFTRFLRADGDYDLGQTIKHFNEVLDDWPPVPRDPYHEHTLAVALLARYEREQGVNDLTSVIDVYDRTLKSTAPDHFLRSAMESNLGIALRNRFQRNRVKDDLVRAIETDERAIRTASEVGQPDLAYRNELGIALRILAERTQDYDLLERAIALGEESTTAIDQGDDPRGAAAQLLSLAGTLRTKFRLRQDITDLNRAIDLMNDARRQLPDDHFDRATVLTSLGGALQDRSAHTHNTADLSEALEVFREAAAVVAAPLLLRARAAVNWGRTAAKLQRWTDAVDGYGAAVNSIALVVPRGLSRAEQESLIAEFAELGTEAAAACLADGHARHKERAVELFEQGRAVLFSQILDTRSDLTDLREADPDLANEFERCVVILDTPEPSSTVLSAADFHPGVAAAGRDPDLRRTAWHDLRQILDRIRSDPRFKRFMLPRPHDELLPVAAQGPVVLINVGPWSSDAVILAEGDSKVVPLKGVSPDTVIDEVDAFTHSRAEIFRCLQALREKSLEPDLDVKCTRARKQLDAVLSWLGERITGPVLDELGYTGSKRADDAPRIWWCPAGVLSLLPLHAARHNTLSGTDEVIDRVISSNTPTLRALMAARDEPAHVGKPALLVVAMPKDLPHTAREAAALAAQWPGQVTVLGLPNSEPALYATVKDKLGTHMCVHFACHGEANLADPFQGCLELADKPLTVMDLIAQRVPHGELAFLSACTTARAGHRLPNEPIHLAGACQLAGFRHVVASLWEINDEYAADLGERFYTELGRIAATTGGRATAAAARSLHEATLAVREDGPRFRPEYWATYIHIGA